MRLGTTNGLLGFFWVLSLTYSQDVAKDVANYAKRRASAQGFAFLGHKTKI